MSDALHFDRLDAWLAQQAQTPYGDELLRLQPRATGLELERRIDAAKAWADLLGTDAPPELQLESDCRPALTRLARSGLLDGLMLAQISALLNVLCRLRADCEHQVAAIGGLTAALGDYEDESQRLRASVAATGLLLDGASAELGPLRKRLESARRRHAGVASELRDELHADGHLQDRYVTQRDDRHVLPVKASAKRQFGGVIHDASRSGKTAYVEPAELLAAGHAVRQAEQEVSEEERRIYKRLSEIIAARADEVSDDISVLATLDSDRARGGFGRRFDAVAPRFEGGRVSLHGLRPPALLLAEIEPVVAVDLELSDEAPVLVISGPNGGGKSVALTAAAWAFELAQRGMGIPARQAVLPQPPFQIWPIVGDAADDRQAHSTFSGHLEALRQALEGATGWGHLVLIDEIASGTEPMAGGAIACGFLETFAENQAYVIATTHYDPVKHLALEHDRMRAAAVRDRRDPEVAFQLFADEVGGSHPIKLAIDLGLPDPVIARARHHLDPQRRARLDELKRQQTEAETIEQTRQDLQRQREELEAEKEGLAQAQRKQQLSEEKRQVAQAKASAEIDLLRRQRLAELDTMRNELSQTIKELRARRDNEAAKEGDRLFDAVKTLRQETDQLRLETSPPERVDDVEVGDTVRLYSGGNKGVVQEFRGRTALVLVEGKVFHLRREQLQVVAQGTSSRSNKGRKPSRRKQTNTTIPITEEGSTQLDLRGLRAHEAEARIDRFLQRLCDLDVPGRIIHGIGSGALRKTTLDYLRGGPWKVAFRSGMGSEGGDGVTIVVMED